MGSVNSQQQKQNHEELITYEEYLRRRPGNNKNSQVTLIPNRFENIHIVHKVFPITKENKQQIHQYIDMLEKMRNTVDCDNLYLPVMYKIKNNDSYCSEDQKLEMFFEYYEVKLKQEIKSRRADKDFFSEEQIWYILFSLAKACRKFQKYELGTGPLKTSMILLNQKGHLKLINILSSPEFQIKQSGLDSYYAPEQLMNMRGRYSGKVNANICQTYSIGMILLEVCSLIDSQAMYNMEKKTINEGMLSQVTSFIQKKYSKLLVSLIKTMLSAEQNRPLPSQIYDMFKPYEKQILNLQPFKFSLNGTPDISRRR